MLLFATLNVFFIIDNQLNCTNVLVVMTSVFVQNDFLNQKFDIW